MILLEGKFLIQPAKFHVKLILCYIYLACAKGLVITYIFICFLHKLKTVEKN